MKKKIIIGVDNGNANTKTAHHSFVSGVTSHDLRPPLADDLIEFEGKFYTLSNKRNTYTRDKTKDNRTFVLTLFAIAKEILELGEYTEDEILIHLAVGLPPEHYAALKDKFAEYFTSKGKVSFNYNDMPFNINIVAAMVFPQAFSAIATKPSNLKEYSRTYIVDIGGYTTDVLLLANGRPDLSYCRSLELGIITMNNSLIGRISGVFDTQIEEEHIFDVLMGRKTVLSDEIKEYIFEEAKKHANEILNNLREQGIDLKANPAIFVGGGSLLLREYIEGSDKTSLIEFLPDISANAAGYKILADSMARKKS